MRRNGSNVKKQSIKCLIIMLSFSFTLTNPAFSQDQEKPPLSPVRISGELVAGTAGGLLVGGVVLWSISRKCDRISDKDLAREIIVSMACYGLAATAAGVVFPIGTAAGVYGVGTIGDQTGPFLETLGYSYLGALAGVGIGLGIRGPHGWWAIPMGAAIGGTYGFNLSRKYESTKDFQPAVINFKKGQAALAFPLIYPGLNPENDSIDLMFDLVRIDLK